MRKVLAAGCTVLMAVFAFGSLAGASDSPYVTLQEFDADAYGDMVAYYVAAGFNEDEAIAAAGRIVVDGVYPSDLVTPTPAPTPTPTEPPTGTCTQAEWEAVINAAAAIKVSPWVQLEAQCGT